MHTLITCYSCRLHLSTSKQNVCLRVIRSSAPPPSVIYISRRSDNLKQRYGTSRRSWWRADHVTCDCLSHRLPLVFFYLSSRRLPPPALCWTLSAELTERHVGSAAEKLKCNFKGIFDVFFCFFSCPAPDKLFSPRAGFYSAVSRFPFLAFVCSCF